MTDHLRANIALWFKQIAYDGLSANAVNQTIAEILQQPRDRAFARECLFGSARHFERLDWLIHQLLQKPLKPKDSDLSALLITASYQLIYLNTPSHAVISESVEAVRALNKDWAAKMINGVLRNLLRQHNELMETSKLPLSVQHLMPQWLIKRLKNAWPKHWQEICKNSQEKPPLTLRVNQSHNQFNEFSLQLAQRAIEYQQHPTVNSAIKLTKPLQVTEIPLFETGLFSVQDLSAQLAAWILPVSSRDRVLDACAAPGGKTAHLLERHPTIKLTAIDSEAKRATRIEQNLQRIGLDCELIIEDATKFQATEPYDAILLDAPCSATGVIRRQPDIKLHRHDDDIYPTVKLQRALLDSLWQQLKTGGYLLYATCSLLPDENHKQIKRFLKDQPNARVEELPKHITDLGYDTQFGLQIFPQHWHDGFFYCLLKKS
jgi:16S rRNA (cytosine967-C5)-methyltransferase